MTVLILRQKGSGPLPAEVVDEVAKHPDLQMLDHSAKMLRVEGRVQDLQAVAERHSQLQISEERFYSPIEPVKPMAEKPTDNDS